MEKFVAGVTVLPGVKVNEQLVDGAILAQVFPVSVTNPSSAVPVKLDVTFDAVVESEVFVIVRLPELPLTVRDSGEPLTAMVAAGFGSTVTEEIDPNLPLT